jgi:hypothetical protein
MSPTAKRIPSSRLRELILRPSTGVRYVIHLLTVAAVAVGVAITAVTPAGATASLSHAPSFLGHLTTRTTVASTVPGNGDVNPYGVAIVPRSIGRLDRGSVLVSNFNNSSNAQGTGSTIVEVSPQHAVTLFAHIDAAHLPGVCPGGIGLTTALAVFRSGWVVVGSLPTADGSSATAKSGCLLVLDATGRVVETWSGPMINGPWDLAAVDDGGIGTLFVTNVLNGTVAAGGAVVDKGTVVRIQVDFDPGRLPRATSMTTIATGFPERTDPAALVVGPTGVAVGPGGVVYVADTAGNRLAMIPDGLHRMIPVGHGAQTLTAGGELNGPLGLALTPDGHLLSTNGGDGNIVETTPFGHQVATLSLDASGTPPGAGALFGLAVPPGPARIWFVDDADNTLNLES